MKEKLSDFYKSLNTLKDLEINNNISGKRDEIKQTVLSFAKNINNIDIKKIFSKNKEMMIFADNKLASIKNTIGKWEEKFLKLSKEEEFRDKLKSNFIVIVYGKVKAGKSTLGNFVAKNCLKGQKPYFVVYDKTGNEQNINELSEDLEEFEIKITECTNTIQLFTLGDKDQNGGISWVDTPGLLSMTEENGDLAKKYIEAADYIIFPTSSDAPLQNDEIEQIKNLVNSGKNNSCIRLLITKSDISTKDEVDGKIVTIISNKTQENRAKQQEDVSKRVKESIPNINLDDEILSISILTAKEGIEKNDEELFENSNIVKFYDSMTSVLKEKAKRLKEESPYKRINAFIEGILGETEGLGKVNEDFNALKKLVDEKQRECKSINSILKNDASLIISEALISEADNINQNNCEEAFKKLSKIIDGKIKNKINDEIYKLMNDFTMRFDIIAPNLDTNIQTQYRTSKHYVERGFIERVVNVVTFGLCYKQEVRSKKIAVGDNKNEIIEKNRSLLKKHYENIIDTSTNEIEKQILLPCKEVIDILYKNVEKLKNNLENIKRKD